MYMAVQFIRIVKRKKAPDYNGMPRAVAAITTALLAMFWVPFHMFMDVPCFNESDLSFLGPGIVSLFYLAEWCRCWYMFPDYNYVNDHYPGEDNEEDDNGDDNNNKEDKKAQ